MGVDRYDASRLANFGRDTSRSYAQLLRAQTKLCLEINDAIDDGISPVKIAHDVMGRCSTHEERINLLSILKASSDMEKIPKSVMKPFSDQGIRIRRI